MDGWISHSMRANLWRSACSMVSVYSQAVATSWARWAGSLVG